MSRKKYDANLPRNLTYRKASKSFFWRNPLTDKEFPLGQIARRDAITQAIEANNFIAQNHTPVALIEKLKGTYVLYLGWFDGNPATLDELPPEEAAKKFVEYMGGADAILQKAKADFDQGNYRWVAQVVSKVVFADPNNQNARNLEADALEQLGYQAESGPWRNFYLTGAQELRNGVVKGPTPNTASPDTVRAMTPEMFFDFLAVHINGEKAGNARAVFNIDLGS
ncbi:hypothetical protein GFK09_23235, partial [Salmonella enterica subsp. enterica serovar Enteritidis]|nr:hypothetical protein [Salmonella enterica subsp. enterica serovar Enteritidis]